MKKKWGMKSLFDFKSIKNLLTFWMLILGLLPLIIFGILIYYQRAEIIKETQSEKMITIRDLKVRELRKWLENKKADALTIAQDYEIREINGTTTTRTPQDNELIHENARRLMRRYLVNYPDYFEILITDKSGQIIILSTDTASERAQLLETFPRDQEWLPGKVVFSNIYRSPASKQMALAFITPILSLETDGSPVAGYLIGRIDLEHSLYNLLLDHTGMGETGESLLVSRDLLALSELRWLDNAPLNRRIQAEPARLAAAGQSGVLETTDYWGKKVLAAFTHIPEMEWGFVTEQDRAEIYAPLIALLPNILSLTLLIGICIILTVNIVARIITVPLARLTGIAREISTGSLTMRSPGEITMRSDEVGILGRTLNIMSDSLTRETDIRNSVNQIIGECIFARTTEEFGKYLISCLLKQSDSQLGAFYNRNTGDAFELSYSLGLEQSRIAFHREEWAGELGRVVKEQKVLLINHLPRETGFVFVTTAGSLLPAALLLLPLCVEQRVTAVVVIGSLQEYVPEFIRSVEHAKLSLDPIYANLLAGEKTSRLSRELAEKNTQLKSQTDELQTQAQKLQQISEELKRQNEELQFQSGKIMEANKLKNEFLSNMSHELRTPLNSIISLSRLLSKRIGKTITPRNMNYLEIIERNGKNLLDLINNILDLSKIEAGKKEILVSRIPLSSMILEIFDNHSILAAQKNIKLEKKLSPPEIVMESDEKLIYQILQNLISNAVKFTEKGRVMLQVETRDDKVEIQVQDTGIGIPAKELPFIFDEFRQVDGSSTRKYEGTGLGLAITNRAIELLNGTIQVHSTPGKGSTFTVILPLVTQGNRLAPHSQNTAPARLSLKKDMAKEKIHILLVEDNSTAVVQVKELLEKTNYQVDIAEGGEQALAYIRKQRPDCIILDLIMPGIDGFTLLAAIRNNKTTADIPVLVMTAKNLTGEELEILKANNVHQLVQKGNVNVEMLLYKLQLVLEQSLPVPPVTTHQSSPKYPRIISGRKPKILIIEDNPDNMFTLKAILDERYEIGEARDGLEGLTQLEKSLPDLILMDILLPRMDGFQLIARIKESEIWRDIPVIAITACSMRGDRERILKAGFDAYISKPVDLDEFHKNLNLFLGNIPGEENG